MRLFSPRILKRLQDGVHVVLADDLDAIHQVEFKLAVIQQGAADYRHLFREDIVNGKHVVCLS